MVRGAVETISGAGWIGLRVRVSKASLPPRTLRYYLLGALMSSVNLIWLLAERPPRTEAINWFDIGGLTAMSLFCLSMQMPLGNREAMRLLWRGDEANLRAILRANALAYLWGFGMTAIPFLYARLEASLYAQVLPLLIGWIVGVPLLFVPGLAKLHSRLREGTEVRIDLSQRILGSWIAEETPIFVFVPLDSIQSVVTRHIDPYWEVWLQLPNYENIILLKRSRNSALQSDAPATAHTQSQSNTPPPHITGHNNDPTDDTPTTTQNYAPPTTDAAAPETLPPNAPHSLNPPPTCSTTTPATPPYPTHCPLSPLAPPDTAPTPHLTPDTLPVRPTHPLPKPIPLTHSPASRLRYGAYAP